MFSIKNSFVDCSTCPLNDAPSAIIDCNCESDLRDIDILFVAENPGKDEVSGGKMADGKIYSAGTPLIGRSGQVVRYCIKQFFEDHPFKYAISNTVLCATIKPDGTTGNPDDSVIEKCKINLFNIISICKPKIILSMGNSPMKAFGITGSVMSNMSKIFDFLNPVDNLPYKVLVCCHPSFVIRNGGVMSTEGIKFCNVFEQARNYLLGDDQTTQVNQNTQHNTTSSSVSADVGDVAVCDFKGTKIFRIPDKYYSEDYRLIDIQMISNTQILFIFRDKNNNKCFFTPSNETSNIYYWYESKSENKKLILHSDDVRSMVATHTKRPYGNEHYESDIGLPEKHCVDYYLQTKDEVILPKKNILFFDIELYSYMNKTFPSIQKATYPINAFSFSIDNGEIYTYLLSINGEIQSEYKDKLSQFKNCVIFDDEKQMIQSWVLKIHELKPDFICGWNINKFDIPYIYYRMMNIGMDAQMLSPFNVVEVDHEKGICNIGGYVCLDMLWLFKNLTYTGEPSYSLENISQKYLGRGKQEYSGDLSHLYRSDIKTFVSYSITDVDLLVALDAKLKHISLQDELRKTATTTHRGALNTMGLVDGLFNTELKKSGYVMKNARHDNEDEKITGAYVRETDGGIFDWVIDFDYTSLYPSIIVSMNIGPNTYEFKMDEHDAKQMVYEPDEFVKQGKIEIVQDPIYNKKASTVDRTKLLQYIKNNKLIVSPIGCVFKPHSKEKSFFYPIVKSLFTQRKKYKKIMFEHEKSGDKDRMHVFHNMQLSYKILLNSLYGVLANGHFRFYNIDMAYCVTKSGQELIKFAGEHIDTWLETERFDSVNNKFFNDVEKDKTYLKYCDTDSMFLHIKPYLDKKQIPINVESINSVSKTLYDVLNKNILVKYAELHNIPISESMFELKNELICKRYYSVMKKKYACHVISKEGIPVDEIDIKGLEIKRSDFSSITKKMLIDIVTYILKCDEISQIQIKKFIDDAEKRAYELINNRSTELYKTVSYSKDRSEYKTLSQHIKGMEYWNLLEYDHFKVGDRGYLVPILGIDTMSDQINDAFMKRYAKFQSLYKDSDLNVIVIPEDFNNVPSYYIINKKQVISFSIHDRVDLLLAPLMKRQNKTVIDGW